MSYKKVAVTTTNGFDNLNTISYKGPITAHVVVGMNFFKDFFSSITDIFGGKSKSYQNALEKINYEVIDQLKFRAHSLGANSIVGLKVDVDEIGAQGKSMLMISAIGTAIVCESKSKFNEISNQNDDYSSLEQFNFVQTKLKFYERLVKPGKTLDDKFWDFVSNYQVKEFYKDIVKKYEEFVNRTLNEFNKKRFIQYYSQLDDKECTEFLYNILLDKSKAELFKNSIANSLVIMNLLDYRLVIELIENGDFATQKIAIYIICKSNKVKYYTSDIEDIDKLIDVILRLFSDRGEISIKTGSMFGKEKQIWLCECGKENDIKIEYCVKCYKDIKGFEEDDYRPKDAVKKLKKDKQILQQIISSS